MFYLLYYFIIPAYIRCYMFDFYVLVHSDESSVEIPFLYVSYLLSECLKLYEYYM